MNKHGHTWTQEEDQLLLALVAQHYKKNKRHTWQKITPHFQRTERSIEQRYYVLKAKPKQMKLDMEPIKTPLRKRSITRKSFLWGLYTVEREG